MERSLAGLALTLLAALAAPLKAQTPDLDRRAVLATVQSLFDGMRAGDSAAVRAAFHPEALLATALERPGGPLVRIDTLDAFVRAVGAPHDEVWDERIGGTEVRIDGPLAAVWTEYVFYAGTRLSHCGVDAFQLARTAQGWRIIALTDTRRRERCTEAGTR